MKIQRFIPFFLILSILTAVTSVVYWPKAEDPGNPVIGPVNIDVCKKCVEIRGEMEKLATRPGAPVSEWSILLVSIQDSGVKPHDQTSMITDWAIHTTANWDSTFTQWSNGGGGNFENHLEQITVLKALLNDNKLMTAGRLKTLSEHAQAFRNFNWLTKVDISGHFSARLSAIRNSQFKESDYSSLYQKVENSCKAFNNRAEVVVAKSKLGSQKSCHQQIHLHYEHLEVGRWIDTHAGHNNYSPPKHVQIKTLFYHGTESFLPSEFRHYFQKGRDTNVWEHPIWL